MKYLKILGLAAIAAAALMAFAGTASATELTCGASMCSSGTEIKSEAEGHAVLDSLFGKIECASTVAGKTTNTGSVTETVDGPIEALTFTGCTNGAVVTPIKTSLGELIIHTQGTSANNNGTLTSTGTEVTIEAFGFHCIFKTNETDLGTVTGSATTGGAATLDISATIPRTGGRSGSFCGASAPWTGSYKVTAPNPLNID